MSRDVRTRKKAVVDELFTDEELNLDDDCDDNGKSSSWSDKSLPIAIIFLLFVLPVCLFLFFSWQPPRSHAVLSSSLSSATGASAQHPNVAKALAPFQVPARHPLQQESGLPAGPEQPATIPLTTPVVSTVQCATTAGPIRIAVHQEWSPHGAERFLDMVRSGFFGTHVALFRAVRGFLCQTGIPGSPEVHKIWKQKGNIQDDPQWLDRSAARRMKRGYLSFAGGGANSRGTEFFFSFRDIDLGTSPWEVPFATLIGDESFQAMDHWYTGYGDLPAFGGAAPAQGKMYAEGLAYLQKDFPEIDYITGCNISSASH